MNAPVGATVYVTVQSVNDPPQFEEQPTEREIGETARERDPVGAPFTATDVDHEPLTLSYSLTERAPTPSRAAPSRTSRPVRQSLASRPSTPSPAVSGCRTSSAPPTSSTRASGGLFADGVPAVTPLVVRGEER